MSEKNVEIRQYNGSDYDTLFPKCKMNNVDGSLAVANGGTGYDGSGTITNLVSLVEYLFRSYNVAIGQGGIDFNEYINHSGVYALYKAAHTNGPSETQGMLAAVDGGYYGYLICLVSDESNKNGMQIFIQNIAAERHSRKLIFSRRFYGTTFTPWRKIDLAEPQYLNPTYESQDAGVDFNGGATTYSDAHPQFMDTGNYIIHEASSTYPNVHAPDNTNHWGILQTVALEQDTADGSSYCIQTFHQYGQENLEVISYRRIYSNGSGPDNGWTYWQRILTSRPGYPVMIPQVSGVIPVGGSFTDNGNGDYVVASGAGSTSVPIYMDTTGQLLPCDIREYITTSFDFNDDKFKASGAYIFAKTSSMTISNGPPSLSKWGTLICNFTSVGASAQKWGSQIIISNNVVYYRHNSSGTNLGSWYKIAGTLDS